MSSKTDQLKAIKDKIVVLKESPLYAYRTKNKYLPVIGDGNHDAHIMFIGEAPGLNEAKTGRPFVGAAGRVLEEMLASINLKREDVYITNIVKDRPPENRDPLPAEIKLYTPFLLRQIEIIKPNVIATLGRYAMTFILEQFAPEALPVTIGVLHGRPVIAKTAWGELTIVPLYHPAAALYDGSKRAVLREDFKALAKYM